MNVWTTFAPGKICWELTYIKTLGKAPSSDWQENLELIKNALRKLKGSGISGIRLVIYPDNLTRDGKVFDLKPIDKMLRICDGEKVKVDLCIGPFQYPYYPGIYLPRMLLDLVFNMPRCLDTTTELWDYGMKFLEVQLAQFGKDKRIDGFHLANEWPDPQRVSAKESVKSCISSAFMLEAVGYIVNNTDKTVSLNTNIPIHNKKKIVKIYADIFRLLGEKGKLGVDIYPTQITWKKDPIQKAQQIIFSYKNSFKSLNKILKKSELYFAEVEAQPWGGGQSWYQLIREAVEPEQKILRYGRSSLYSTRRSYIKGTGCKIVSLWGSDFWLSAEEMGIKWPLESVKSFVSQR